ncbi:threonine-phosphate decarboxylase [Aestuariibius sp. HNIBRBA575]|uniref:threonine-phosphate decarboxylase n=1 Tax=Aestuariibius sp. HNIBRBA575 TaxID=3233343 RepID=UPI0034A575C3
MNTPRDHGGGLDAAIAKWGGTRADWVDLSTGINPVAYPVGSFAPDAWTALPDRAAFDQLEQAARNLWNVPVDLDVIIAPGASALIARIPALAKAADVTIPAPTYNEHAAAFVANGWQVHPNGPAKARVIVNPNNPDGRVWTAADAQADFCIIDESFGDVAPDTSLMACAQTPNTIVLKSFGKFWGLAGMRLGFAIGRPETLAPLREAIGPWQVSGPALQTGATALADYNWAIATRARLAKDAAFLDQAMAPHGALVGGTSLFRLYQVPDAVAFQTRLAEQKIWSRVFPYSKTWLRLGLPHPDQHTRISAAL